MNYRQLTPQEAQRLESQGCRCSDWTQVEVADPFNPDNYRNVTFSGWNKLGTTEGTFLRAGQIEVNSGIYDALIHNCTIGNHVYINHISNYIVNYDIADDVMIENVGRLMVNGESTFGNGVEVSVLNETGGREVPIYDTLSAHVAYILAMYRHNPGLTSKLRKLIAAHVESHRSDRGRIDRGVRILNTGTISAVNVGEYAAIDGASKLQNGTIVSERLDPVFVGANVLATDFIMEAGAKVDDGAVVVHSFVGQACQLSRLFSAHDSLFFANCACENGEAAAIFAGPYTVTMHKSSLLIAGMFSFLNAGSGSNQSNHMYKLGPIHQGVVARGSKTTSDSYVLWPANIGAFSLVMGRHVSHPDTSRLPFSYLIETAGKSHLVPGVNLKSVGTVRDAQKWPKRDKRRTTHRLDLINFNLLSPYTIGKMFDGIDVLNDIENTSGPTSEFYSYQGLTIKATALRKGRQYYDKAIDKFMGNSIIKRLERTEFASTEQMRQRLTPTLAEGEGEWVDMAGLIAPKAEVNRLIDDISTGAIGSLREVEERLRYLSDNYYEMEWTWVWHNFARWYGKPCSELTADDILAIEKRWIDSVVAIDHLLYDDARKEFSSVARIGFGVDDRGQWRDSDFDSVRGEFDRDPFVHMVLDHMDKKTALGRELRERISRMKEREEANN